MIRPWESNRVFRTLYRISSIGNRLPMYWHTFDQHGIGAQLLDAPQLLEALRTGEHIRTRGHHDRVLAVSFEDGSLVFGGGYPALPWWAPCTVRRKFLRDGIPPLDVVAWPIVKVEWVDTLGGGSQTRIVRA